MQRFAFVQQFDPPEIVYLELLRSSAAEFADFEMTFCDVKRCKMERIYGAFVLEDQNIWSEVGGFGSAGMAVGWWEAVAVMSLPTIRSGVCIVIDDVLVVFWLDARWRAAGVGEGGIAPSSSPEGSAHKEKEGEKWE